MKKIFALLLTAIFLLPLWGCSRESEDPTNPYRPVTYRNEYFEDGSLTSQDLTEYRYDEHGFLSETLFYQNDTLMQTNTYENDEMGNPLRITTVSDETTTLYENKLTLDDQGRILRQEDYTNGALTSTLDYTYTKDGNVATEIYTVMEEGSIVHIRHREMTYDRKGQLIREVLRNADGSYTLYAYDDGRKVKTSSYSSGEELTGYWEFTYNEAGQLTKESFYTCEQNGDTRTSLLSNYNLFSYGDSGLTVTKTSHYATERPFEFHTVTTCDEYGNQLLHERYQDGELCWRITQEFEPIP